jgi:hypothetical protein
VSKGFVRVVALLTGGAAGTFAQDVVLFGNVLDDGGKGVGGVRVVVEGAGTPEEFGQLTNQADGSYEIPGLPKGRAVVVRFVSYGYSPREFARPVRLADARVRVNHRVLAPSRKAAADWIKYAEKMHAAIDQSDVDLDLLIATYRDLPAESKVEFAQATLKLSRSPLLKSDTLTAYSKIPPASAAAFENGVRASMFNFGDVPLPSQAKALGIPEAVAFDIFSCQLTTLRLEDRSTYLTKFGHAWGSASAVALAQRIEIFEASVNPSLIYSGAPQ